MDTRPTVNCGPNHQGERAPTSVPWKVGRRGALGVGLKGGFGGGEKGVKNQTKIVGKHAQ